MDIAYSMERRRIWLIALYSGSLLAVVVYRMLWSKGVIGHRELWPLSALSVAFMTLAVVFTWRNEFLQKPNKGRGFEVEKHEKE
jgi:hypothetical protein